MYKFNFIEGAEFYNLLCKDDEFCMELGRAILAAGRLESTLKKIIAHHSDSEKISKATLGRLIKIVKTYGMSKNLLTCLEVVAHQRNYLTHNIHSLLSGMIEETILESSLIAGDVSTYADRAWQLQKNLNDLADLVDKEMSETNCFKITN